MDEFNDVARLDLEIDEGLGKEIGSSALKEKGDIIMMNQGPT